MRIAIVGLLGSGKTLLLTFYGLLAHRQKLKVISNYHTEVSEFVENNRMARKLRKLEVGKCFLLLDEIATIIDSRNPPIKNVDKTYAFLQSRKKETEVRYTTQAFIMADKRIRLVTDKIYIARHHKRERVFTYKPYLSVGGLLMEQKVKPLIIPYEFAEKYLYPIYDTNEIVLPINIVTEDNVDWEFVIENFEELKDVSKQAFVGYMKSKVDIVSERELKTIFDLLNKGHDEKAKEVLYG